MIARFFIQLPYHLSLPEGEQFPLYEYEDSEYKVHIFPPVRGEKMPPPDDEEQFKINGVLAFQADILKIDFVKDSFNREQKIACDPPLEIIDRAVSSFLVRLRHVARASQIRPFDIKQTSWKLQYLNDDETELAKDEQLVRGRGLFKYSFSWIALNKDVWENIHSLQPDYQPPPWDTLILDAYDELPKIGPSVVLAATALEVFIANQLNALADIKGIPVDLWEWINERRREPSVEEQYNDLLKLLANHSLKEEPKLWESFMALKEARNTFVHRGVATIAKIEINSNKARQLVDSAYQIILKIKEWLPPDLHWPEFNHQIQFQLIKKQIL